MIPMIIRSGASQQSKWSAFLAYRGDLTYLVDGQAQLIADIWNERGYTPELSGGVLGASGNNQGSKICAYFQDHLELRVKFFSLFNDIELKSMPEKMRQELTTEALQYQPGDAPLLQNNPPPLPSGPYQNAYLGYRRRLSKLVDGQAQLIADIWNERGYTPELSGGVLGASGNDQGSKICAYFEGHLKLRVKFFSLFNDIALTSLPEKMRQELTTEALQYQPGDAPLLQNNPPPLPSGPYQTAYLGYRRRLNKLVDGDGQTIVNIWNRRGYTPQLNLGMMQAHDVNQGEKICNFFEFRAGLRVKFLTLFSGEIELKPMPREMWEALTNEALRLIGNPPDDVQLLKKYPPIAAKSLAEPPAKSPAKAPSTDWTQNATVACPSASKPAAPQPLSPAAKPPEMSEQERFAEEQRVILAKIQLANANKPAAKAQEPLQELPPLAAPAPAALAAKAPSKQGCIICFEPIDKKAIFNCSHTYCFGCAEKLKNQNGNCPTCRTPIQFMLPVYEQDSNAQ